VSLQTPTNTWISSGLLAHTLLVGVRKLTPTYNSYAAIANVVRVQKPATKKGPFINGPNIDCLVELKRDGSNRKGVRFNDIVGHTYRGIDSDQERIPKVIPFTELKLLKKGLLTTTAPVLTISQNDCKSAFMLRLTEISGS
jgi:hypothetical protein